MKKIEDFPHNQTNPFIGSMKIVHGNKLVGLRNGIQLMDSDGSMLDNTGIIAMKKKVDKSQFVKLYRDHLKEVFNLGNSEYKVFGYCLERSATNSDVIKLDIALCMGFTGIKSRTTIYRGISGLLEKSFIARAYVRGLYYLNPSVAFNGTRLQILKEYELRDND
jgi:hypothetical protein